MIGTRFIAAGLALFAGLALTPATRAGDTFRLDMSGPATTSALDLRDSNSGDLFDVAYRGGFHGGFYRPGPVGYRPYYGGGFARPYYGGYARPYYRPLYYGGFYRPYYGAYYARSYYGGYATPYYGGYYSAPSYYYYSAPAYYNPCALPSPTPAVTLRVAPTPTYQGTVVPGGTIVPESSVPGGTIVPESSVPQANPGTFPYDGGPKAPVPMPRIEEAPRPPQDDGAVIRPADERLVSLPTPDLSAANVNGTGTGKWAYPAYGEKPKRTSFAEERPIKIGR